MATKIVFFGNERIATAVNTSTPTLRTLVGSGFEVCAVVVNNEKTMSRKQRTLEISECAMANNIPIFTPSRLSDLTEQLIGFGAEIAVLVAYGKIIPGSIINIFPKGIINIHPSLLPLHRGSTPIENTILHGEKETGVSIMKLEKEMDAGPVYKQIKVALDGSETKQEIANMLLGIGADSVAELLPYIIDDSLVPIEQNNDSATYDHQITKNDSVIDWNESAIQIHREIRAYAGWPGSATKFNNIECVITSASIIDNNGKAGELFIHDKKLGVYCGKKALIIKSLKPAGKQEMDSTAFLAGYKQRLGL